MVQLHRGSRRNIREWRASPREAADFLGLSYRAFRALVERGKIPRVRRGVYCLGEIFDAYVKYRREREQSPLRAAMTRLVSVKADLAEYRLEQMQSKLHAACAVRNVWNDTVNYARERLLALPSAVAPLCVGKGRDEIQALLKAAVYESLCDISGYNARVLADAGQMSETVIPKKPSLTGRRETAC